MTINLSHNGKVMRQYRAVAEGGQKERRLGAICGVPFLEHALAIEWQHGDLAMRGWVADPNASSAAFAEIQYCYVNGRMMRDRLINHAIRQACEDKLGADQQPAFVLYLEIDPHQVDVNVHPAKHEVRFHQSRLVHDFIYQGVLSVLQQQAEPTLPLEKEEPAPRAFPENRVAAGRNHFAEPAWRVSRMPRVSLLRVAHRAQRERTIQTPNLAIKNSRARCTANCWKPPRWSAKRLSRCQRLRWTATARVLAGF